MAWIGVSELKFSWVTLLLYSVLPLTMIFPCSKEILVLARNLQGNKIYKEMARKNTKIKGNCKDFCNLSQLQVLNQ
jgi:hypothetical protein